VMNNIRLKRVESLIREKVSTLIITGDVKDPRVDSTVALTRIKVARNLSSARVWVSSFGGVQATQRAVIGLNSAAGFIQSRIGREIHMKNTPRLRFVPDDSVREGLTVSKLIEQAISKDNQGS